MIFLPQLILLREVLGQLPHSEAPRSEKEDDQHESHNSLLERATPLALAMAMMMLASMRDRTYLLVIGHERNIAGNGREKKRFSKPASAGSIYDSFTFPLGAGR
jgi:hypothetical protein